MASGVPRSEYERVQRERDEGVSMLKESERKLREARSLLRELWPWIQAHCTESLRDRVDKSLNH